MYIFTPRSILLIKKHYIHPKTTGQEVAFFSYMKNYGMPMLIDRRDQITNGTVIQIQDTNG
jgi:hypothetical protein